MSAHTNMAPEASHRDEKDAKSGKERQRDMSPAKVKGKSSSPTRAEGKEGKRDASPVKVKGKSKSPSRR